MKIRKGFVSNSSSSSFIAVFAKIFSDDVSLEMFKSEFIKIGQELIDLGAFEYDYLCSANWAGVDTMPEKKDLNPKAKYIVFSGSGGAGDDDEDFRDIDTDDLNYHVELSDFRTLEQEIYNLVTEENGFTEISKGFGAGRNG